MYSSTCTKSLSTLEVAALKNASTHQKMSYFLTSPSVPDVLREFHHAIDSGPNWRNHYGKHLERGKRWRTPNAPRPSRSICAIVRSLRSCAKAEEDFRTPNAPRLPRLICAVVRGLRSCAKAQFALWFYTSSIMIIVRDIRLNLYEVLEHFRGRRTQKCLNPSKNVLVATAEDFIRAGGLLTKFIG
jgi:hypothetical protein